MKLLLDQNLPISLKILLRDIFPDMLHVRDIGMESASDDALWRFAKTEDITIVTKDSDFLGMSLAFGFPPKVVWLKIGNRDTHATEQLMRDYHAEIEEFFADTVESIFIIEP